MYCATSCLTEVKKKTTTPHCHPNSWWDEVLMEVMMEDDLLNFSLFFFRKVVGLLWNVKHMSFIYFYFFQGLMF